MSHTVTLQQQLPHESQAKQKGHSFISHLHKGVNIYSQPTTHPPTHTSADIPSLVNVMTPPRCFVISFHLQPPSFFRQASAIPPLTKTISYCGNHFKVVYAISHHSKLECAPQCTHRSSYVEPQIQVKRSGVFWCQRLRRRLLKRCQA